jgi:hypothetical protein
MNMQAQHWNKHQLTRERTTVSSDLPLHTRWAITGGRSWAWLERAAPIGGEAWAGAWAYLLSPAGVSLTTTANRSARLLKLSNQTARLFSSSNNFTCNNSDPLPPEPREGHEGRVPCMPVDGTRLPEVS